jgi:WD40 repeat protein
MHFAGLDDKQPTENVAQRTKSQPPQTAKSKESKTFAQKKDHRTHAWLYNSLKGHAVPVDDMDLSPNGKYLVSSEFELRTEICVCKDNYFV